MQDFLRSARAHAIRGVGVLIVLLLPLGGGAWAEDTATPELVIGTKHAPPFAIKHPDGSWTGISLELWQEIATKLNVPYRLEEWDLSGLLRALEDGQIDAAVAALTITPERERAADFSHPFYVGGLGIAVAAGGGGGWLSLLLQLVSAAFVKAVLALSVVIFVAGLLVWWFERKRNPQQFGGRPWQGIGSGFWWSAVTMTTVGYGDKAPVTFWGRIVALVWMFTAIIIISSFTAAIASALTAQRLSGQINGPGDLPGAAVGTVAGSTSALYLQEQGIRMQTSRTVEEGLASVERGALDAFVYDAPILQYLIHRRFRGVLALAPRTFEPQQYGMALPTGSPLRESLNRALLDVTSTAAWQDVLARYLGTSD